MIITSTFLERKCDDENRWVRLHAQAKYSTYMASIPYEYSREISGRLATTVIFSRDGEDIAGVHYSLKRSFAGFISTADIISGIVFRNEPDVEIFQYIINHFIAWAKSKRATYLRINSWLPVCIEGNKVNFCNSLNSLLINLGFSKLTNGGDTYWIDLTLSEVELKKKMNSQTLRKIKQAEKSEIIIETTETYLKENVQVFYEFYNRLGDTKKFDTLSKERFFVEVKALFDAGAVLFFLKYHGVIINVALATTTGIASYYHGALNPDYKNFKDCPSPGHYMQWTIIKYLKQKGIKRYDLAYCPGPIPIEGHPQFDMWRFKYGFGGIHIKYMPVFGKALKPITGKVFSLLKYRK